MQSVSRTNLRRMVSDWRWCRSHRESCLSNTTRQRGWHVIDHTSTASCRAISGPSVRVVWTLYTGLVSVSRIISGETDDPPSSPPLANHLGRPAARGRRRQKIDIARCEVAISSEGEEKTSVELGLKCPSYSLDGYGVTARKLS